MNDKFPILTPERMPRKIDPCPIVEAIFEVRFRTDVPWRTLPGLLHEKIRERYPKQLDLPLAQIRDEVLLQEPTLAFRPLMQFVSSDFLVQLGPRALSLVTTQDAYPGWDAIKEELKWLLGKVEEAGFLQEAARLGVRYIDFFEGDVFEKLSLAVNMAGIPLKGNELKVSTVLKQPPFTVRLLAANSAVVSLRNGARRRGSVLDVDAWLGPLDFDLFSDGLAKFGYAHEIVKQWFFGLAKPDFVATLNPVY